jgi:membrane-associated phospholipid phosphatase
MWRCGGCVEVGRPIAAVIALSVAALSPSIAHAADPVKQLDQHFTIDPVTDIVLSGASAGASALLELILSTGEIVPQAHGPTSNLLSIDRIAVTQTFDPNASLYSDLMLGAAVAFAAVDPLLSGVRDGWDAALVDAVMYAESLSMTLFLTDVTKIAVRRPRPIDYVMTTSPETNTNNELSFYSGHASMTAAVTATATYLAFLRSPNSPRPWITLGVGLLLTGFVSYERVRSGAHFPTDVIAGSMAGAAIGVLVPHLHRQPNEAPHLWIGAAPTPGGGSVSLQGRF